MQWSHFQNCSQTWLTRVIKDSRLGTIRIAELVLKLAKARAEAIEIQCAISSRSGACQLNMSPASGFDYPHIRIESRESASSVGSYKGRQRQICAICKRFFLTAEEVGSWVKCPTLISHCLAGATTCGGCATCGGVRGCSRLAIDQQSYNGDKGLSFGRELFREFAFIVSDTKFGVRNNFAVRIVEARGRMRAALLRKC